MIPTESILLIRIYDVIRRFNELTGWVNAEGGLHNADFSKSVYDLKYPTIIDGGAFHGESSYIYRHTPDGPMPWNREPYQNDPSCLKTTPKVYENHPYIEINLMEVIGWLHFLGELAEEDTFFFDEW